MLAWFSASAELASSARAARGSAPVVSPMRGSLTPRSAPGGVIGWHGIPA